MKHIYMLQYITLFLFVFWAHQTHAQCTDDNTYYLDLTPTGVGNTQSSTCTYAGEYNTVDVVAGASYTFSTCGAGYDTQITLINDGNGNVEGYNDDFCGLRSEITWTATFTGTLRVLIDEYFCSHNTTCTEISVTQNTAGSGGGGGTPPGCDVATAVSCGSTVTGSTVGQSNSGLGTCSTAAGTGGMIWYTVTGDGNTWEVETTGGSNYDTKIWVYEGSCSALTCVTGNDDGGAGTLSLVSFGTTVGTTYYVIVGGFGGNEGTYEMTFTNDANCNACAPPAAPVTVDDDVCSGGVVNLTAAGSGGTLEWYDAPTNGNLLGTGTSYSPTLGATTTYYVQESTTGTGAPTSLTTLFAENNGQSGIMFDIVATNDITINSFETNVDATGDIEIYYRAGTHVGNETNAGAWTLIGSATGVPNNAVNTATPIPINVNTYIPAGQTYAFYITFSNGSYMNYTDGTAVGAVSTTNADMQVLEGTGKAYAFGTSFSPRVFNGNINYTPGSTCSSTRTPVTGTVVVPPTAPNAVDDQICLGGIANLGATVTSGNTNATINWYDAPTGGNFIGTGTAYSTPALNANTTYYIEEDGGTIEDLTTAFNENNGQSGIMFDINATNAVTITSFETNADVTDDYEIYYKAGTHVGSETNAGAWTLAGSATGVVNNAANTPTPIPIGLNVAIPAGQTYAFYITMTNNTDMNYTNGTAVGNTLASDANIEVLEGTGKGYPFGASYTPRNPNIIVHYNTGSGCASTRTPVNATVRMPIYATTATTTTANTICTVNEAGVDWTYYYDNANPDDLLFAIAHDPNNLGNNNFTADVNITVKNDPTNTGYDWDEDLGLPTARWVMGRYWNVEVTSGAIVDPVWVRFYYQPGEKSTIMNAATAWQAIHGGNLSGYVHFKTVGSSYDPVTDLYPGGVWGSIELANNTDNLVTTNGTNYVEYQGITSFSGGSIVVGVTPFNPTPDQILLPVELESFTAEKQGDREVMLDWATNQNESLDYFVIERSKDAIDFQAIGEVTASNASADTYDFLDDAPHNGVNYYRLKIMEKDGQISYSPVRAVTIGTSEVAFTIKPNPFENNFSVEWEANVSEEVEVTVFNTIGEVVYQQKYQAELGVNQIDIESEAAWTSGQYIVQLKSNNYVTQQKMIKR